ncbi:MAG: SRPBCC family protein [Mycobacterium sp.]
MVALEVSSSSDVAPADAWKCASDLQHIGDWMTIFGGWRSSVPSRIERGTRLSSLIKVKGFRNVIHWSVTAYREPEVIELKGHGRGGVAIALKVTVADEHPGSRFHLCADLTGGPLRGPIGRFVARVVRSEAHKSIVNLAELC